MAGHNGCDFPKASGGYKDGNNLTFPFTSRFEQRLYVRYYRKIVFWAKVSRACGSCSLVVVNLSGFACDATGEAFFLTPRSGYEQV